MPPSDGSRSTLRQDHRAAFGDVPAPDPPPGLQKKELFKRNFNHEWASPVRHSGFGTGLVSRGISTSVTWLGIFHRLRHNAQ